MKRFFALTLITSLYALPTHAQQFNIDTNQIQGAVQGMLMQSMFNITDTDKDGRVSKTEAIATAEKRFEEADVNQDGFMTKEEMQSAHQRQMQPRQPRMQPQSPPYGGAMGQAPAPHQGILDMPQSTPPISVPSQY